jgi:hypothetical protein
MLNSIGIKSLYISGWAFQNQETGGNQDTVGHAWTVALINGTWIELDSTWGLFEGIPAGHIYKNFFDDSFSWYWYDAGNKTYDQNRTIQLYNDINDILIPSTEETNILSTYDDTIISSSENNAFSTDEDTEIITNTNSIFFFSRIK